MQSIDFTGRTVFVAGGSSGIGNGIARAFRAQNAQVHVCGTRKSAADYEGEEGSELAGMTYYQLDVCDDDAIASFIPAFSTLDVLVCAQGIALYKRAEFGMEGFRQVMDVNLNSVMALSLKFQPMLEAVVAVMSAPSLDLSRLDLGQKAHGLSVIPHREQPILQFRIDAHARWRPRGRQGPVAR